MSRYVLFGGPRWSANGGWLDYIRSAETLEDALPQPGENPWHRDPSERIVWWEVFDLTARRVVRASPPVREARLRERCLWEPD
jgi:hypothetical protein